MMTLALAPELVAEARRHAEAYGRATRPVRAARQPRAAHGRRSYLRPRCVRLGAAA